MKKKLSRKLMTPREQTVDIIENNLEQHLHRLHELQIDIVSGRFGVDVEKCAVQTKTELMGIVESFIWLRRYHISKYTFLNYTSKDGFDAAELCSLDPYSQLEFEMDSNKPKEESFPLTKRNAMCGGLRLHVKLTISEGVECELDYTIARKTVDDILQEKIEKLKCGSINRVIAGFSNKR